MKHVSWVVALVVGFAIGFVGRGSMDGVPGRGRPSVAIAPTPGQQGPQARPQRAAQDDRTVYKVPVEDSAARGPADALVTIVESSDFQCPFCKRGAASMKEVEQAYAGQVRVVFKHNALPFHPRAVPAAMAVEEARAQGGDEKFWALHDKLFELAPNLDDEAILGAAKGLGLDAAKVKEAIDTQKYKARLDRDQKLVSSVGASATPTYFVNGRKVVGAVPAETLKGVVAEELQKAQQLVRAGTPAAQVYGKLMETAATTPIAPTPNPGEQPAPAAAPAAIYRKVPVRADDPARGPADAKVTVVLFSDFQCPYCGRVEPTLKQLEEAFPGQLRIVWKHQPLSFHANAKPAAIAAEAAREQGKFWPMHDKLFQNQAALSAEDLARAAQAVGLDMARYGAAISAQKAAARVAEDQALAAQVGANGTPTMFLNCRQSVGARPFEMLKPVVEEELKKADALLKGAKPGPGFYDQACGANLALAAAAPPVQPTAAAAPSAPVQGLTVRADDPAKGSAKAPVTLVVFSDFQCPFCSRVGPTLEQVEKAYGDKVRIVFKHQPLSFHPNALPAALAAEAARQQGKFWPMHDKLFENQRTLSDAAYEQYAKELGLNLAKFQEARRSPALQSRIAEDQALAAKVGADGTPTLFVNGVKVEGAVPFEQLKTVIDGQLRLAAR